MPMRNAEGTVSSAARSTLRAMPRDAELVVVDDGSTDTSVEVLADVKDRRVRVLSSPQSQGVAAALNKGLADVDCELVGRMDADDVCLPWRFTLQLRRLGRHCDVSFGQVVPFRRTPPRMRVHPPVPISSLAMPFHLVLFNPVHHPTMVATAESIRGVAGYQAVAAEDYDLWMRLVVAGYRLERIGTPVMLARQHEQQVTAAAEWRTRPPLGEAERESYEALCRSVVGKEPTWSPNPRRNQQDRARLIDMTSSVREHSRRLPAHERRFLETKLRGAVSLAVESPADPS